MGCRVRPCTVALILTVVVCLLICIGLTTYHLKNKEGKIQQDTVFKESRSDLQKHDDQNSSNHSNLHPKNCKDREWECNIRLDPNVYPIHYDIYLNPETHLGVFHGRVSIQLNITTNVNHIRIHTKDLGITASNLSIGNQSVEIKELLFYPPNEFLIFRVLPLASGIYNLTVDFNGNLTRGIIGLYRSAYLDPTTNRTRYVIGSKFQPTYARRAFPCLDEPGFKSTFSVSVVKPTDLVALSNMPVSEEELDKPAKGFTIVHFQKSVPMVTYLVAFAVGDFECKTSTTKNGIPVRVFATRFQLEKTQYAIDVAPRMLEFYEDYFDIKYPLPKLDIIGIPDFVSGAMEHWGLISFRESNLLYHNGVSSAFNKQRIASVLAHEIAHMWFGNLMTLKWWSDLWLNEGFASYCEYKAVNHVHPDWEIETQFLSQDLTPVLILDGKLSSHPIVQTVEHPDQITEIFDTISYNKGASVIRMLENYMGASKFQHGVTKFLKAFSYKNAETSDLWVALATELGPDTNISLLMDTWTRQMGYPLIEAQIENNTLTITQERYMENKEMKIKREETPFGYYWEIPLNFNTLNKSENILMKHTQKSLNFSIGNSSKWLKINSGNTGYFRVKYSGEIYKEIRRNFRGLFLPIERCGVIDDVFSLAYSNYLSYDLALDFGTTLREDFHLVPWHCGANHILTISALLENSAAETYGLFRKYIINLTSPLYKRYKWTDDENEKHLDRLLKVKIFSLSCSHGYEPCLDKTLKLFQDWLNNGVSIPPGLRPVVYKWGMWQSKEETWDKLWNLYLIESDSQERVRLISSLAFTQHTWLIRRFIALAQNESYVRRQDFFTAMKYISINPVGNPILWSHYRNEYENMVKRFSVNDRYFGKMILDITTDYASEVRLQEMTGFMGLYAEAGAGKRARLTAIETVKNNIQWAKRNAPIIHAWLKNNLK